MSERQFVQHPPEIEYIFQNVATGEEIGIFREHTYVPIPERGSHIVLANTHLSVQDEEWVVEDQSGLEVVLTGVNYTYNSVYSERESEEAHRILCSIRLLVETLPPVENQPEEESEE